MTLPNYWGSARLEADENDEALAEAIAVGAVPARCLLGGVLVADLAARGQDPCGACPCPRRDVCGGRPQTTNLAALQVEHRHLPATEAGARKIVRLQHIEALNELLKS